MTINFYEASFYIAKIFQNFNSVVFIFKLFFFLISDLIVLRLNKLYFKLKDIINTFILHYIVFYVKPIQHFTTF